MTDLRLRTFAASFFSRQADDNYSHKTPKCFELQVSTVSGGDINQCFKVIGPNNEAIFVKTNSNGQLLKSEYSALSRLAELGVGNYPRVLGFDEFEGLAMLALEYISLSPLTAGTGAAAGQCLAAQHEVSAEQFGWHEDGHIGFSTQQNTWCKDWGEFFTRQRLEPQLDWAITNGLSRQVVNKVEKLIAVFANRVDFNNVTPSLLHGDLWAGNIAYRSEDRSAVLYDPAPYFGDAEVDVAMTLMFGALPKSFYKSYRYLREEPDDFELRVAIYNSYHALNHFNLFGTAYQGLVSSLCDQVI